MWFELVNRIGELFAEFFPSFEALCTSGGEDDKSTSKNLVELDGFRHSVPGRERSNLVVRRITAQAEIVDLSANIFGKWEGPIKIRRIKLDHFVAHFGDGADGGESVFGHLVAHRVELDTDREFLAGGEAERERGGAILFPVAAAVVTA